MDHLDLKILDILQTDASIPVAELAERIGLSQTPCWRRLRKLEEAGVIRGRVTLLDPVAMGLGVNVFAEVKLKQHDEETLAAFEGQVKALPEVTECFLMSGERDYLIRVVAKDIESYQTMLKKVLLHLPGVGSIVTSFSLNTIKWTTRLPILPGGGGERAG